MIEALWSVEFVAQNGNIGGGVAVFESGRILGGDSSYFYTGSYRVKNGSVEAEVNVTHYFGQLNNIFGNYESVTLTLAGQIHEQQFTVSGTAQEPQGQVAIRLTRRAELP